MYYNKNTGKVITLNDTDKGIVTIYNSAMEVESSFQVGSINPVDGKNVCIADDTHIYVGDYTMIGPNVVLATAGHPILPPLREKAFQYNVPVHIGRNCWIGAGAVILPGVTIGDNTVIGAGSVVTRDLPANVVAVGKPCRVLRPISEHDREFYFRDKKIDWDAVSADSAKS
mgnify:CR=1 FL=1